MVDANKCFASTLVKSGIGENRTQEGNIEYERSYENSSEEERSKRS